MLCLAPAATRARACEGCDALPPTAAALRRAYQQLAWALAAPSALNATPPLSSAQRMLRPLCTSCAPPSTGASRPAWAPLWTCGTAAATLRTACSAITRCRKAVRAVRAPRHPSPRSRGSPPVHSPPKRARQPAFGCALFRRLIGSPPRRGARKMRLLSGAGSCPLPAVHRRRLFPAGLHRPLGALRLSALAGDLRQHGPPHRALQLHGARKFNLHWRCRPAHRMQRRPCAGQTGLVCMTRGAC